ncbi:MAG: hypothetical protein ACRDKT_11990 [Actinomycetota bacterium]
MRRRHYWFDPTGFDFELTATEVLADLDPGLLSWAPESEELER